jgi:hypothetical protein
MKMLFACGGGEVAVCWVQRTRKECFALPPGCARSLPGDREREVDHKSHARAFTSAKLVNCCLAVKVRGRSAVEGARSGVARC